MTKYKNTPEQLVAPLMRSQHGLVTRAQALAGGVSAGQLARRRRRRQLWLEIQPGVYCLPGSARSREQAILAACLAIGNGTVASHSSAAWLWGLIPPGAASVEVRTPHDRRLSLLGVVVHRTRRNLGAVMLRDIPVTSPVATVIDLAQSCNPELVERALDRGRRMGLVSGTNVLVELNRQANHGIPGVWQLRALLAQRGYPGVPTSALEQRTQLILRRGGVPKPVRELATGPGRQYRADFAWPAARLIVEVDGFDTHGTPEALRADLARQNDLVGMGWSLLRFTWQDITRRPDQVVKKVKLMLEPARADPSTPAAR